MKAHRFLALLALACLVLHAHAIKFVRTPYLQNVTETEAVFVWETDQPSVGWVEIAPDDGTHYYSFARPKHFHMVTGIKAVGKVHAVKISGLKPGTTYRYRVLSQEVLNRSGWRASYGDICALSVYKSVLPKFTTLDRHKPTTSFAVLNDIHNRANLIEPLLKQADYENKDLIFFNGDMVSIINSTDELFDGFMNEATRLFATKKSPYYNRGNHETRGEQATRFRDYFSPFGETLYRTLRQGPICFILLDCGEDKPDEELEYAGLSDFDNYRTQQAEWLKGVQETEDFKTAKYRVVLCHMPTRNLPTEWHGARDCIRKFTPILNGMAIDVMLSGHTHKDEWREADDLIHYPVIVNSNNGVIAAEADGEKMTIRVIGKDGKEAINKTFKAKR